MHEFQRTRISDKRKERNTDRQTNRQKKLYCQIRERHNYTISSPKCMLRARTILADFEKYNKTAETSLISTKCLVFTQAKRIPLVTSGRNLPTTNHHHSSQHPTRTAKPVHLHLQATTSQRLEYLKANNWNKKMNGRRSIPLQLQDQTHASVQQSLNVTGQKVLLVWETPTA